MDGITVRISGIPQVRERLGKAKQVRVLAVALNALRTGALQVVGDAKRLCPVDTGRLRASITSEGPFQEGMRAFFRVGTDVEYAPFVEFGTGTRGAGSAIPDTGNAARVLIGYQYGSKPGMRAKPFLFPAYEKNRDQITRDVGDAVAKELGAGG